MKNIKIIPVVLGALIALGAYGLYTLNTENHTDDHTHSDDVHVHSDFLLYLNGEAYNLTDKAYQSSAEQVLLEDMHLHDNTDEVMHRHGHDITIADFFNSLGFELTEACMTNTVGIMYCSDTEKELQLYVNGERTVPITSYVNQEEDRILLFYGADNDPILPNLLRNITDVSCVYSGTCPERGIAPPESCGLTCEL